MFSRRLFLQWIYGSFIFPFLPGCDQPETELALETLGPILPYIQNVSTEGAAILWQSSGKKRGTVEVFRTDGTVVSEITDSVTSFHEIQVTGLTEDTTYFYQVKEGNIRVGPIRSFRTALSRDSTQPFSFIVLGDSGLGTEPQLKVADQMLSLASDASFVIHTGDVVYDGYEGEYRGKFFEPYRSMTHRIPFYPVLGDHDLVDEARAFYKFFLLPSNPIENSENYYSFTYGNALFIALDANLFVEGETASQIQFLEDELSNSSHTWKFIYLSQSIHTTAIGRDSKLFIGQIVSPIAERYGVQIVFGGDIHAYERFLPKRDYLSAEEGREVVYISTGGGGAELRDMAGGADAAVSKSAYHFLHISINDQTLTGVAYDFNGNVIDEFEFTASSA